MKYFIYILYSLLIFVSCRQETNSNKQFIPEKEISESLIIETPNFEVTGLKNEDFDIIKQKDTTFYIKRIINGIDGKIIRYNNRIKELKAKITSARAATQQAMTAVSNLIRLSKKEGKTPAEIQAIKIKESGYKKDAGQNITMSIQVLKQARAIADIIQWFYHRMKKYFDRIEIIL